MGEASHSQLNAILVENCGVFELTFSQPSALHCVVADARAGHDRAAAQLAAIGRIMNTASGKRRCLLCNARIRGGRSGKRLGLFGFLHAPRDNPAEMLGHLLCADCVDGHSTEAALRIAIADYYRTVAATELARISRPPASPGGA
jgi:hypothetical protein